MRYAQIRAFHYVAIAGGFSRAAAAMNQSQPSVSEQVRRLEEAYDTLLFHRDTRNIRLTEAGEGLLRLTQHFFEAEQEIANYLSKNRAVPSGRMRIVADSATHIMRAIGRFRVAHPGIQISLWTGNTEEVLARLRNYEAEFGVVGNLEPSTEFDRIELGQTPIVALAAPGIVPGDPSSLNFADLPRWPLIFREPGSRTRAAVEAAAAQQGLCFTPAIQVEGREALREVVATGAGLGFVTEAEFGHDPRLRKIKLSGVRMTMSETLICLTARRDVAVIRAFVKTMT